MNATENDRLERQYLRARLRHAAPGDRGLNLARRQGCGMCESDRQNAACRDLGPTAAAWVSDRFGRRERSYSPKVKGQAMVT